MCRIVRNKKYAALLVVMLASVLLVSLTACSPNDQAREGGTIVLADAQWASIQFHNSIAQIFIEEGFGYNTEITSGSTSATFTGLENGDIDVYMEAWVQNIEEIYDRALESGNVIEVSTNFDDNRQGLYVPTYVIEGDPDRGIDPMAPGLKSVDLPKYKDVFTDDEDPTAVIYGSPPGWEADALRAKYGKRAGMKHTPTSPDPMPIAAS